MEKVAPTLNREDEEIVSTAQKCADGIVLLRIYIYYDKKEGQIKYLYKQICINCGYEFESDSKTAKYCSRECYRSYVRNNSKYKDIRCATCGKLFHPTRQGMEFCSVACRVKSTEKRETCICDYCGKPFKRIVSEVQKNSRHYCSVKCRRLAREWSNDDIEELKRLYGTISYAKMVGRFSKDWDVEAIKRKAIYLGLTSKRDWSDNEIDILKQNYHKSSIEEMMILLPNRTCASIRGQARKYNLVSRFYLNHNYSPEEDQYIVEHYLTTSNKEMAATLHRAVNGIARHMLVLDLHRPQKLDGYSDVYEYIRSRLVPWRDNYRRECGFSCQLTGSRSNVVVHHIRSFGLILAEAMDNVGFPFYEKMSDYTQEQLNELFDEYIKLQESYKQYICVTEPIHKQFHKEYGFGNNTVEQWNEFIKNNNYQYVAQFT